MMSQTTMLPIERELTSTLPGDENDDVFRPGMLSRASVASLRRKFAEANPFPHVVIDGLFQPEFLERVLDDYTAGFHDWVHYDSTNEVKTGTRPNAKLGKGSQRYFDIIHRGQFMQFLTAITAIEGLLPDPSLFGGGLHKIEHGGRFSPHIDFNKHPVTLLDNRLVFITYLNKNWEASYGGALELWDMATKTCVEEVVPVFGRSILFAHSECSLHGHPNPVTAPDRRARRSVAAYFYTNNAQNTATDELRTTQFLEPVQRSEVRTKLVKAARYVSPMLVDGLHFAARASKTVVQRMRD